MSRTPPKTLTGEYPIPGMKNRGISHSTTGESPTLPGNLPLYRGMPHFHSPNRGFDHLTGLSPIQLKKPTGE